MNKVAPEGQVFVCGACGRRSKDRYGDQKIDRGWDSSCMSNAILCFEEQRNGVWQAVGQIDSVEVTVTASTPGGGER